MIDVRTYFNLLVSILFLGMITSCTHDGGIVGGDNQENVTLTLSLGQQAHNGSRVEESGLDELNENLMETVDLFFYRATAGPDEDAVFSKTMELPADATVKFDMPVDKFKQLFPTDDDTQCQIYAIVNRPNENTLPDNHSLASLKDNIILHAPQFKVKNQAGTGPSKQDIFVMDGLKNITRTGSTLTGDIPVERVAAKISMIINGINTVEQKDDEGKVIATWEPVLESVKISLRRGSVRTKLGSTPTEYIYPTTVADLFTMDNVSLENGGKTTNYPFYTYPTNWKNDENSRTHFILTVHWQKVGAATAPMPTYYEVNVNNAGSYTQRNRHYKITQEISVLGSEDEETPVVLYPSSYIVLPWGYAHGDADSNNTDSDGDLSRFRYLVVDETNVEMDNVRSKQIYFFSSDPVDLSSVDVKWDYTAGNESKILTLASKTDETPRSVDSETGDIIYVISNSNPVSEVTNRIQGDYKVTIRIHNGNEDDPNDRSYIYVEHPLNNNMSQDADYTSYYMDLVVQHSDEAKYHETIKITQYPMIVIKAEANSVPNNTGGVYVNGKNSNASYGGVHGLTGNNTNPNRYIISVSALDTGSEYIIGDPRESAVNNWGSNFASNIPTMKYDGDAQNRTLKYYHPTDETSKTSAMISPQFMIASSYGVTNAVSKADARNRCATYQEDGYPAGRWRLPTQAEIEYIVQLSAWGIMPRLFGSASGTTNYWSANGAVQVDTDEGTVTSTTMTSGPVRCVYDTWYWTDKCNKTTFTWGDKSTF